VDPIFETVVIASSNPAKVRRYKKILTKYACQLIGLAEITLMGQPEEKGETAEENAEIKAKYYAEKSGLVVFSEDEALYVNFLSGEDQPGVHVRRINGKDEASDGQLLAYWEKIIANVPRRNRKGKWHIACCIAHPNGMVKTFSLDFPIMFFYPSSPVKIPGWPLSSIEGPLGFNKPHSELTKAERLQADRKIDEAVAKALIETILDL